MNRSKRLIQSLVALVFGVLLPVAAFAQFQQSWVRSLDPPAGASRMTLEGQGNVCVAGASAGNLISSSWAGSGFLTLKYDPSGNLLWAANDDWGGKSGIMSDMTVDPSGNVYATGGSYRNDPGTSFLRLYFLTAKYSPSGQV